MVGLAQRKAIVEYAIAHFKISVARASKLFCYSRSNRYHKSKLAERDEKIRKAIVQCIGSKTIGRKKVIVLMKKKKSIYTPFQIRRVYQKSGFSLFKRPSKKRIKRDANPIKLTTHINEEWAIDFMSDSLKNGRKIRALTVIDHYDRSCKGIRIKSSFAGESLIEAMQRIVEKFGKPSRIRTDNGPEFISKRFQLWLHSEGIIWNPIQPGKPQQNGVIERFNKTFREDILDRYLFQSIQEAENLANDWVEYYNTERPHESLGFESPSTYKQAS